MGNVGGLERRRRLMLILIWFPSDLHPANQIGVRFDKSDPNDQTPSGLLTARHEAERGLND